MTEAGHGSNVQQLQTTATYDPATRRVRDRHAERRGAQGVHRQRRLPRPDRGRVRAADRRRRVARRARAGRPAPRRATAAVHPGVRIEDSGEKMGLNGVDNGRIWFDHVRVPRDALLDRYGGVNDRGRLREPDREARTSASSRCSAALVQGRVCISGASVSAAKTALTIAVRYGLRRRQFGPPDEPTRSAMLDYRTHQRRLMPLLAQDLRAALRAGRAARASSTRRHSAEHETAERERRELESLAAGDEGDRELARDRDDPDLPRVLRRRRAT